MQCINGRSCDPLLSSCDAAYVFSGSSSVLMDVTMVTDPELMISDHLSPRVSKIINSLINDVMLINIGGLS